MQINSKEIDLVIQGPIESQSYNCTSNINNIYDECSQYFGSVILSTYENDDLKKINKNIHVIINQIDRKYIISHDLFGNKMNNRNFQAISSLNGILNSNAKYVFKTRTDQNINFTNFLSFIKSITNTNKIFFPYFINHTPFSYCDFFLFSKNERLKIFYDNVLKFFNIIFMQNDRLSEIDYVLKDLYSFDKFFPKFYFFPRIEKFTNSSIYKKYPTILWKLFTICHSNYYEVFSSNLFCNFEWRGKNMEDRILKDPNKVFQSDYEDFNNNLSNNIMLDENDFDDFLYFFQIEKFFKLNNISSSLEYRKHLQSTIKAIYENKKEF